MTPTSILPLVLVVVSTATATSTTTSFPNFQHLNVKETIKFITQPPKPQTENLSKANHRKPYKLNIIHRDNLPTTSPPLPLNHTALFLLRIRRDTIRVAALTRRLSTTTTTAATAKPAEFGSDVVSGMDEGSGEYFVRIGVGSPARPQYLVLDSGSDVVWVQCQPCTLCYNQSDPVFDPAQSSSFSPLPCGADICSRLDDSDCRSGHCRYQILYNDGSSTAGTLALETITLGTSQIHNVAIGCGHSNRGLFVAASGLLGLGDGPLSLINQLGGLSGGAFSYCLASRTSSSSSTGSLQFGRETLPVGAAWIALLRNPLAPSFYYVSLSGIGVAGERLPIPESVFSLTDSGEGGAVMDTGTAVTRLPAEVYVALRDWFVERAGDLPRVEGVSIFDTCYDLSGFVAVRVPTVSFYFKEGMELTLPAKNFMVAVDGETATFCLAFAASDSGMTIIGNIQQQGIQISIDGATGFLGFGPNVC